jgi:2,4-dienoyl-CoA reductase-like NADH-dependent reductase (Old Yellow Enzyme family)
LSKLFSPIALRDLTLSNRILVSPMCQYCAVEGQANAWHAVHLGGLALSGAGMLCVEATAVEPAGRITPGCLGLWDDRTELALANVLATVRAVSRTPLAIQLAHAGRKGSSAVPWAGGQQIALEAGGWLTDAPSALPHKLGELAPAALDEAGRDRIVAAFGEAAMRAARLGFDAIEIHGAHGYLIHEFLSPISNQRTDAYGGSLENRFRLALEVFDRVRAEFPSRKPVGVKLSATDWLEGGWDLEQTVQLAKELKARGADWIGASSGGISPLQKISPGPGYQVPFAEAIKHKAGITTTAVGLITEAKQAEAILAGEQADMVAIARGMLYDPRWGWHAAAALGASLNGPPQYWRAPPHGHASVFGHTVSGLR